MPLNDDEPSNEVALTPEELILDDEFVTVIDDHRYLIEADGASRPSTDSVRDSDATSEGAKSLPTLAALRETDARHGIVVAARTDGVVDGTRLASDDVREVFAGLLRWYASQLDAGAPPKEVIRILLRSSGFDDL